MMEMIGATMTPAQAALAKSATIRDGRFFVFHLLLVEVAAPASVGVAVVAAGEVGEESARPWLEVGSFMVAWRGGELGGGLSFGSRCHWMGENEV